MATIMVIVGTESGNAQMVADALADELPELNYKVTVVEEPDTDTVNELANFVNVLVCTSTHGDGDLPDNIQGFHQALTEQKPDLSHLKYGVIALGDQTYHDTFCQGGKTMDATFSQLGAIKVGERLEVDACTQPLPDEDAVEWAKEWINLSQ